MTFKKDKELLESKQIFDEQPIPLKFLKKSVQPYSELWGEIQKRAKEKYDITTGNKRSEERYQKIISSIAVEFFNIRKILSQAKTQNLNGDTKHDLFIWIDQAIKMLEREGIQIVDPINTPLDTKVLETIEVRCCIEDETISNPSVHETLSPWIFWGDKLIKTAVVIGKTQKKK